MRRMRWRRSRSWARWLAWSMRMRSTVEAMRGRRLGQQARPERDLVAAQDARLEGIAGTVANASLACAHDPRLRRLAQRDLARRAHCPATGRRLRFRAHQEVVPDARGREGLRRPIGG